MDGWMEGFGCSLEGLCHLGETCPILNKSSEGIGTLRVMCYKIMVDRG